jgi:hypothetical protein
MVCPVGVREPDWSIDRITAAVIEPRRGVANQLIEGGKDGAKASEKVRRK